jgi:DNA-binding MarR family transcriptional regulator
VRRLRGFGDNGDRAAGCAEIGGVEVRCLEALDASDQIDRFSLSQGSVLGRLDREGSQSTSKLATAERVRPQSMGQTIAELEAEGLLERRPDPADGRRALIELTDAGGAELGEGPRRREGWPAEALDEKFSDEEREVLDGAVRLLGRLAEL